MPPGGHHDFHFLFPLCQDMFFKKLVTVHTYLGRHRGQDLCGNGWGSWEDKDSMAALCNPSLPLQTGNPHCPGTGDSADRRSITRGLWEPED